jgi:hypothetical protein
LTVEGDPQFKAETYKTALVGSAPNILDLL